VHVYNLAIVSAANCVRLFSNIWHHINVFCLTDLYISNSLKKSIYSSFVTLHNVATVFLVLCLIPLLNSGRTITAGQCQHAEMISITDDDRWKGRKV